MERNVPIQHASVGLRLKTRREQLRLSLGQVELDTKIRGKYLTAIESSDYAGLPNDIYSRGFVQHYGNYLGLNGRQLATEYADERGGVSRGATRKPRLERGRVVVTGRLAVLGGLLLVSALVVGYLAWQFSAIAAPPRLALANAEGEAAVTGGVVTIAGSTTPGAEVSINDVPVATDADGGFSSQVALRDGVNPIQVRATSKLGKTTTATRNVLASIPEAATQSATLPAAPFDGVAVLVSVKSAAGLVVMADGREVFRGPFVAGRQQLFQAKDKISITTTDAGATSVGVTNAKAAGKNLSPLGRPGEMRQKQEFAKDTVIP